MSADRELAATVDDPQLQELEEEAAPPSVRRIATEVKARSSTLRCTLAGVGAWAITIAPLVVTGRAGPTTRLAALIALAPAIAGPQLLQRKPRLARHVGVTGLLGLSVLTWLLASLDQVLATVDTFRAVLGVLSWGVFALSWSHPWSVSDAKLRKAPEGETVGLKPRRKAPPYAVGVAVMGAITALACLSLAWVVDEPSRAVFAQALAVGCAVALLTSASRIAVLAGKEKPRSARRVRLPHQPPRHQQRPDDGCRDRFGRLVRVEQVMPSRATAMLLVLFAIAAIAFGAGLWSLTEANDLLAILLGGVGALALRALHQAARLVEGGR